MSRSESQYCAYSHVSSMLQRSGSDWWLAMFDLEVYFDDSGTDGGSPIAVAACYVANKTQWDEFVRNWDEIREGEGFDCFHMAEFVAKPSEGHEPYCHWDNRKKERVYQKLASTINLRMRKGFAVAVPKQTFDRLARQDFKDEYCKDHYCFAVTAILELIAGWRSKFGIASPMQYVFDQGSFAQQQIAAYWDREQCVEKYPKAKEKHGIVPEGVMFQDRCKFKPLQAADILAWQMRNHMRKTYASGKDPYDPRLTHPGFKMLLKPSLDMCFYREDAIERLMTKINEHKAITGEWPWNSWP